MPESSINLVGSSGHTTRLTRDQARDAIQALWGNASYYGSTSLAAHLSQALAKSGEQFIELTRVEESALRQILGEIA